ncbi:MAG: hypothetical protein M3112_01715 [Actinomycetia bacterium]|nr:hypothetical protein [Actinomycetes bacterium]
MLSSSANAYDYPLDIAAIRDPSIPTGIPGGTELLHFVDALVARAPKDLTRAQTAIINTFDQESLVDAAAVFGNFEMMNRVAEGSGIPISPQAMERMRDTIDELGLISLLKS